MKVKFFIIILTMCVFQVKAQKKPNVIFISIDDLNDWVGFLDGNTQVKTPNMDRFAKTGLVMTKAYAPSTVCCPSRTAILTGKHATNTGVYGNSQNIFEAPKAMNVTTLPEYFAQNGYYTLSTGKIFHLNGGDYSKYFTERVETGGKGGVLWSEQPTVEGIKSGGTDFKWGTTIAKAEETKDFLATKWAVNQLKRDFNNKPFFLALGISKPHLPWIVPQQFYDMYPLDKITTVPLKLDDLNDIKDAKSKNIFSADSRFLIADKANKHKEAQRAYLACVSYVDYCLGQLFDAIENSKYADNTIVMLWGDHGWHLGEKLKYGKTDLWEESCRVPFIVKAPGVTPKKGGRTEGVVNLIDMYPTLLELCGLPSNKENDGRSFAKLLSNPGIKWNEPTLTTYQYKNHSLTDGRFRYTWYGGKANSAEELYDHSNDPLEHNNLASNPAFKKEIERLKVYLPKHNEMDSPKSSNDGESEDRRPKAEKQGNKKG